MKCPQCGGEGHRVLRTDETLDKILRTRQCDDRNCSKRWRTAEVRIEVIERADDITSAYRSLVTAVGEV